MITIKDIAKLAGVSQGTVSNALNGRGNVSTEKMRVILKVAKEHGYVINAQAKNLRKKAFSSKTIAVILPNVYEKKYSTLISAVNSRLEESGYTASLFVTDDSAYIESTLIDSVLSLRAEGAVSVTSFASAKPYYDPLISNGMEVAFALRDPGFDADFLTFDLEQVGYDICSDLLTGQPKSVCVLGMLDSDRFDAGCRRALQAHSRNIPFSSVHCSPANAVKVCVSLLNREDAPDTFICSSDEYADALDQALYYCGSTRPIRVYALSYNMLPPCEASPIRYCLNYRLLGTRLADMVIGRIEAKQWQSLAVPTETVRLRPDGFIRKGISAHIAKPASLRVLLMRGRSASALMDLTNRFTHESNIRVDYTLASPDEMQRYCLSPESISSFDVVRASVSALPIMDHRLFVPFSREDHRRITDGMIPKLLKTHSYVDGIPLAIPFDIGSQIMVYRKDLFSDPIIQRSYYEKCGDSLRVPEDFEEYSRISRFFSRGENESSPVEYGSTLGLGTDSEVFLNYILRYRDFCRRNSVSLSSNPVFDFNTSKDVFESIRELGDCCRIENAGTYFGHAHDHFVLGNTALEIVAFNYAADIAETSSNVFHSRIGYSRIPNSTPAIGGGSLLIPKASSDYTAALSFVDWACGPVFAESFTYLGSISPHLKAYQSPNVLALYPWYQLFPEIIAQMSDRSIWDEYNVQKLEGLIASAIRSVIQGKMSAYDAASFVSSRYHGCRHTNGGTGEVFMGAFTDQRR